MGPRILIVRMSALGDVIHGLPAASHLKTLLPEAEISWLVEAPGADLLAGNPVVDRVIVFPKRDWKERLTGPGIFGLPGAMAGFAGELKKHRFDAALDLQGLLKSSLLAFASGARIRAGFAGTREGAENFLTHKVAVGDYFDPGKHVVEHNLKAAAALAHILGASASDKGSGLVTTHSEPDIESYIYDGVEVRFPLPPLDKTRRDKLDALLAERADMPASKAVALIPGTTWTSKIWPAENWTELGRLLLDKSGRRLILVGGQAEMEMTSRIEAELSGRYPGMVWDLAGKTGLLDLMEIFHRTALVAGADTGPLHLAAATGNCPVLGVFGSTPEARNGPFGPRCSTVARDISCRPCFKKVCPLGTTECLTELKPELVAQRCLRLLSDKQAEL